MENALFLRDVPQTYGSGALNEEVVDLDKLVKRRREVRVVVNGHEVSIGKTVAGRLEDFVGVHQVKYNC